MNTLNFNDADLEANREGRLSDAQNKRLDADVDMIHRHNRVVIGLSGAMFAVVAIFGAMNGGEEAKDPLKWLAALGTVFALLAGFMGVAYWWSMRGLTTGTIRTIDGTAEIISTFTTVKGMRVPLNRLRLRRRWYSRFTFHFADSESLRYFKNGTYYRVYYLPYAMPQALSAEEIDPEKAKR